MWWGMAAGNGLLAHRPKMLSTPLAQANKAIKLLAVLGRWSLSYYMLHQPLMIGALTALVWMTR
jgi:uncharacterized membrane protein